jgi:hypothetical protein
VQAITPKTPPLRRKPQRFSHRAPYRGRHFTAVPVPATPKAVATRLCKHNLPASVRVASRSAPEPQHVGESQSTQGVDRDHEDAQTQTVRMDSPRPNRSIKIDGKNTPVP